MALVEDLRMQLERGEDEPPSDPFAGLMEFIEGIRRSGLRSSPRTPIGEMLAARNAPMSEGYPIEPNWLDGLPFGPWRGARTDPRGGPVMEPYRRPLTWEERLDVPYFMPRHVD